MKISTSELVKFYLKFHACIYLKKRKSPKYVDVKVLSLAAFHILQRMIIWKLWLNDC